MDKCEKPTAEFKMQPDWESKLKNEFVEKLTFLKKFVSLEEYRLGKKRGESLFASDNLHNAVTECIRRPLQRFIKKEQERNEFPLKRKRCVMDEEDEEYNVDEKMTQWDKKNYNWPKTHSLMARPEAIEPY